VSDLPLAGVTVVDVTQIYNGPYATFLMAMAGAQVIKVEPLGGEYLRKRDGRSGAGVPFAMLNANKRCISLNLKTDKGRELFLALAAQADVLAENYAPGVMQRLGLDYEAVRAANRRIIYASGSGYGQSGEYRDHPAMDLTVQAMSGVMNATGFPENPPVKSGAALCDFFGGVHLYGAIMTALYRREHTDEGTWIDVAMLEAVYPSLASNIGMTYSTHAESPARTGNRHGGLSLCPYNVYPAADGYVAIICNNDKHWSALLDAMDRTDLHNHEDMSTMRGRVANMEIIDRLVGRWSQRHDRDALFEKLKKHRVPCAPVRALSEVMSDSHLHERGALFEIDHPTQGRITVCKSPLNYAGLDQVDYRPSSECGTDNDLIYGEMLGLDSEARAALTEEGVI